MACCLTSPKHYLNQCQLIICQVLWHSHYGDIHWNWRKYHLPNDVCMMTSSNGNISAFLALCEGNTPVTDGFTHKGQWRGALVFDLRLDKRLGKKWRRRWFKTLSISLWRHCNVKMAHLKSLPRSFGDNELITKGMQCQMARKVTTINLSQWCFHFDSIIFTYWCHMVT